MNNSQMPDFVKFRAAVLRYLHSDRKNFCGNMPKRRNIYDGSFLAIFSQEDII